MKKFNLKYFDCKRLFMYAITINNFVYKSNSFHCILSLIKKSFLISYHITYSKWSCYNNILFVNISIDKKRLDIIDLWENIKSTIPNEAYNEILIRPIKRLSIKKAFYVICNIFTWISIIKTNEIRNKNILISLLQILDYIDIYKSLRKISNIHAYKLAVFFYDARPIDNFISQYLVSSNIKTATLQHGIMLAPRNLKKQNIDFCGLEFKSFVSSYFLAWNEFTMKEAIKSGIPENKIKVLGCAKCIIKRNIKMSEESRIIGVFLDGEFEKENNYNIINIINQFSITHNYNYILRLHPSMKSNQYDNIINTSVGKTCNKNIPLWDFISSCEFCIVSNSTVLFELESYNIPYLRYSSHNIKDKYKDYNTLSFNNIEELNTLYQKRYYYHQESNNIDILNSYKNFFKQFIQ